MTILLHFLEANDTTGFMQTITNLSETNNIDTLLTALEEKNQADETVYMLAKKVLDDNSINTLKQKIREIFKKAFDAKNDKLAIFCYLQEVLNYIVKKPTSTLPVEHYKLFIKDVLQFAPLLYPMDIKYSKKALDKLSDLRDETIVFAVESKLPTELKMELITHYKNNITSDIINAPLIKINMGNPSLAYTLPLIFHAIKVADIELIKFLVTNGAEINPSTINPLRFAVECDNLAIVNLLLELNCKIENYIMNGYWDHEKSGKYKKNLAFLLLQEKIANQDKTKSSSRPSRSSRSSDSSRSSKPSRSSRPSRSSSSSTLPQNSSSIAIKRELLEDDVDAENDTSRISFDDVLSSLLYLHTPADSSSNSSSSSSEEYGSDRMNLLSVFATKLDQQSLQIVPSSNKENNIHIHTPIINLADSDSETDDEPNTQLNPAPTDQIISSNNTRPLSPDMNLDEIDSEFDNQMNKSKNLQMESYQFLCTQKQKMQHLKQAMQSNIDEIEQLRNKISAIHKEWHNKNTKFYMNDNSNRYNEDAKLESDKNYTNCKSKWSLLIPQLDSMLTMPDSQDQQTSTSNMHLSNELSLLHFLNTAQQNMQCLESLKKMEVDFNSSASEIDQLLTSLKNYSDQLNKDFLLFQQKVKSALKQSNGLLTSFEASLKRVRESGENKEVVDASKKSRPN